MGGAMGALGGDISTMGTNPAGIGIYRSNDVMTSFSFSTYGTESKYGGKTFDNNNNRWSYDNIGIVFASKIGNHTPDVYKRQTPHLAVEREESGYLRAWRSGEVSRKLCRWCRTACRSL